MIASGDGSSGQPANLQSLIQAATLQFSNGLPQEATEKQQAQTTLRELVERFNDVVALPHAERFPALKLIAFYAEENVITGAIITNNVIEKTYDTIYSTEENDLSFTKKKEFLEERVASHTKVFENKSSRITMEYKRFLRNLPSIGGLKSQVMAVKYIESNLRKEATPILKELNLWKYYNQAVKDVKKYDMLDAKPGDVVEEKAELPLYIRAFKTPFNSVITGVVFMATLIGGAYLYSTVFNATNGENSQTPQKDEQRVEEQVSPADYFQQYKQSASFPSHYVIGKGQKKTFDALSQQCISGFTQYLEGVGASPHTLDVKSLCNRFLYDALKKIGGSVGGNDHLLGPNGKPINKNKELTLRF